MLQNIDAQRRVTCLRNLSVRCGLPYFCGCLKFCNGDCRFLMVSLFWEKETSQIQIRYDVYHLNPLNRVSLSINGFKFLLCSVDG